MFTRTYPLIAGTQTETERGDVTVVDGSLDVLQHLLTCLDLHLRRSVLDVQPLQARL